MANSTLQPVVFVLLSALLFLSIPVLPLSVQAQSGTPSCVSKLVPCAKYLNSTNPPDSCCTPLKEAITNETQCLCSIFEDPTILKSFGINLTDAEKLAGHCGVNSSTTLCKASAPSGTPTSPREGGRRFHRRRHKRSKCNIQIQPFSFISAEWFRYLTSARFYTTTISYLEQLWVPL